MSESEPKFDGTLSDLSRIPIRDLIGQSEIDGKRVGGDIHTSADLTRDGATIVFHNNGSSVNTGKK